MNIGYLISGNPKIYDECLNSFNVNLKESVTDVFSHLWWEEGNEGKCYKMHFSEKLEEFNLALNLLKKIKVKKNIIEKDISFDITFFKKFTKNTWGDHSNNFYRLMTPIVLQGLLSQTYSAYQSYLLSCENNYDVIIKSRPDLIFTKNISSIIESLDVSNNTIFFQSSVNGGHLYAGEFPNKPCDWFFLGNQDSMGKFLKDWHEEIKHVYVEGIMHTNELVQHVCKKNNLEIKIVDFGTHIYKQATNYYDVYHNKIDLYLEDFDFEKSYPKNPFLWPYWISKVDFEHFKNIEF